ncbi:MAG TPA: glutaredoxin family protein [Woeseiaceae bacterium]|nr:glutaredoxin family protein [Woeseiaceae bacterium]
MSLPEVAVYTRPGCHLCEVLLESLVPLVRGRARLELRDVDTEPRWRDEFGSRVPVVAVDGLVVCEHVLDEAALERSLAPRPE